MVRREEVVEVGGGTAGECEIAATGSFLPLGHNPAPCAALARPTSLLHFIQTRDDMLEQNGRDIAVNLLEERRSYQWTGRVQIDFNINIWKVWQSVDWQSHT